MTGAGGPFERFDREPRAARPDGAAPGASGALVEARLGRAPQDMLEAAVVLEAWAGVPAQRALETGAAMMPRAIAPPRASVAVLPPLARRPEQLLEGLAFIAAILSIAFWAQPLADALGAAAVTRALTVALPLALALQWALRSRYLSRPRGLAELSHARAGLFLGALAVVAAPSLLLGRAGAVAGLLTLTWTGGTILMRRGWAAGYAAIVLAATPAMAAALPPLTVLAATAAVTAAAVAAALRAPARPELRTAGRWGRTLACAGLGAGLGTMLVTDPSVGWTATAVPALALLPSAVAGVWAGHRLWRLDHAIPRALAGIPAIEPLTPPAPDHGAAPPAADLRATPSEPDLGAAPPAPDHGAAPPAADLRATPSGPDLGAAPPALDLGAAPPASRLRGGARAVHPLGAVRSPHRRALLAPLGVFLGAIARLVGAAAVGSALLVALVPAEAGLLAAFALLSLATLLVSLLDAMGRTGWAALGVACAVGAELAVPDAPFAGAGLAAGAAAGVLVLLPAAVAPLLRPARTLATSLWIA